MIPHQAVGQHLRVEPRQPQRHHGQQHPPVGIILEDAFSPVTARGHVVDRAWELDAKRAGHRPTLRKTDGLGVYIKDLTPSLCDPITACITESAAFFLNQYVIEMTTFLIHDEIGPRHVLTADQGFRLYADTQHMGPVLAQYMSCKLAKVMGPKAH